MNIEVKNITKAYGTQKALDSVSFAIGKGELAGFLGPNGAGKSTMMKIITGALRADEGNVLVNNLLVSVNNVETRTKIGYLPENNPLYGDLYVKESLEITAGIYKLKDRRKAVSEMIELTGLGKEQHKKIVALSKGYKQRVGLAQALIHNPPVLILDEPTTGLDPNQLEEIRNLIREISKEKTVMFSTHIMQEVEAVCNRVIIINNGKIIADGSVDELKNKDLSNKKLIIVEFDKEISNDLLLGIEGITNAVKDNGKWLLEVVAEKDIRPAIFNFAVQQNLIVLTVQEKTHSLESVFQKLTR